MQRKDWSRREAIRVMLIAGGLGFHRYQDNPWIVADDYDPRMQGFYGETDSRPEFVWVNREDIMYHDHDYPPSISSAPEYSAFIHKIWTFNRAMQWVRSDGAILCYENVGILDLTGDRQASAWHTGPDNDLETDGDFSIWKKRSLRRRDCAILPALQFQLRQHPIVEIEADAGEADWQFCIALKGRSGPPLLATSWIRGKARERLNILAKLTRAGFEWNFPEVHFAIGSWSASPKDRTEIRFRIRLIPDPCVVGCLPIIRTLSRARAEGVPILAMAMDSEGHPLAAKDVKLSVSVGGYTVPLEPSRDVWRARIHKLEVGDYTAILIGEGAIQRRSFIPVRVTDGRFYSMSRSNHWTIRDDRAVGPLTGSYQGTFFFREVGTADERIVQTPQQWNSWDRSRLDAEHMHYWESLAPQELNERFQHLSACGFDLLALHSHWGVWERLDAGGRIAPHGAEQLALYLRIAASHGLSHIQALTSGPYMSPAAAPTYGGTIPYSLYVEEGFSTESFVQPGESRFDQLFHQYLRDFATIFGDETSIFALTSSGEGDSHNGPARTNDTMTVIRSVDRNHIFLAETIDDMQKLPQKQCQGFQQDRFGGRSYSCGEFAPAEYELGVYFKFLRMANMYLAEGSWPPMPRYNQFHYEVIRDFRGSPRCWTGTNAYRIRLRDTLWLGLIHMLAVMNTWDEQIANDEHYLLRKIRHQIDWNQEFAVPNLAIRVSDECAVQGSGGWQNLVLYEEALVHLGLMYRLIPAEGIYEDADSSTKNEWLDARRPFQPLQFKSEGGSLPDELRGGIPVTTGSSYACSYAWSQDRRTLLAYVYNTTNHTTDYMWLCGKYHRTPRFTQCRLQLKNLPKSPLRVSLYDLHNKHLLCTLSLSRGEAELDQGFTDHDFFLLVVPA